MKMTAKDFSLPDGGWGWMVVIGVALTNMFNQSLVSLFGLLFGEHLQSMGQGTFGAALVMNLNSVALNFSGKMNIMKCRVNNKNMNVAMWMPLGAGLITGPALKSYSPRAVATLGSILTGLGLVLSSFSTNIWHITLSYGLFVGIGLGLINPSSFIAVNSYFSRNRGRAVGLALAGTGFGQMMMPHVVRLLLDFYGFRGTILIMGALALNGIVGAALFQPVEWHIKPLDDGSGENKLLLKPFDLTNGMRTAASEDSDEEAEMYQTTEIGTKDNEELITLPKATWWSKVSKAMDLQLLKDPVFCSIAIGLALAYTASINFSMLFPYFLQETANLSRSDTALCMSILAAADLLSRLTLPTVTDRMKVSCRVTFLIGAILLTLTRATLAQTSDRNGLIVMSAIYGYVRAATVVNQNLTISEYTSQDKLAGAIGLNMVTKGFLVITVGQFLGWIRDYTGSYPVCLHAQNVLLIIVIVMWTPEILHKQLKALFNRKKERPVDI